MNNELNDRLRRIEDKLDAHLASAAKNEADLNWVRGYIKLSISFMLSLFIGTVTTAIKVFKG